jgi:hypothetical protein
MKELGPQRTKHASKINSSIQALNVQRPLQFPDFQGNFLARTAPADVTS